MFGWGLDAEASSESAALFTVDGQLVCGAHTAGDGKFPAWAVWFSVDDCDVAAARVTELGGSVLAPPSDMDFGAAPWWPTPTGRVRDRRHERGRGRHRQLNTPGTPTSFGLATATAPGGRRRG